MKILMYGINQDTISKDEEIIYDFSEEDKQLQLEAIQKFQGVKEVVIFHSRYRIEYYFHVDESVFQHGDLLRFVSEYTDKPLNEVILQMYSLFNEDVVRHLYELATGYHAENRGSLENLHILEENLAFANEHHSVGPILNDLFSRVISFAYRTKMMSALGPLLLDDKLSLIKRLVLSQEQLKKAKIIVMGECQGIQYLGKIFAASQVYSLTLAFSQYLKKTDCSQMVKQFIDGSRMDTQTRVHITDYEHMAYWLSDADIIIDTEYHTWQWMKSHQDMATSVRQTPKKQLYIGVNQYDNDLLNNHFKNILLTEPEEQVRRDYSDEEVSQAESVFDELLIHQISEFMSDYYLRVNG